MTINADWYAKNGSRGYPFSAAATLIDAQGINLPEDIIVDISLRCEADLDSHVFVSSISIDSNVSITLSRTTPDVATVATLLVPTDNALVGKTYSLTPILPNTFGTIVLGGINHLVGRQWRFESAAQSGLTRSAFQAIPKANRNRFGYIGARDFLNPLRLLGQRNIDVNRKTLSLEGELREAVVFSLIDATDQSQDQSALSLYAGECDRRPESRTCLDPQPIENISGVKPDCCGRIFIEFRGCAELTRVNNHCGVLINCETQVADTVKPSDKLPADDGRLPSEFIDVCDNAGVISSEQDENIQDLINNPPDDADHDYRRFK